MKIILIIFCLLLGCSTAEKKKKKDIFVALGNCKRLNVNKELKKALPIMKKIYKKCMKIFNNDKRCTTYQLSYFVNKTFVKCNQPIFEL